MSRRRSEANPCRLAVRLYVPGCSAGNRYVPAPSVVTARSTPVSVFLRVMVTPGMTPPCSSATVPSITPVFWARAGRAKAPTSAVTTISHVAAARICDIHTLPRKMIIIVAIKARLLFRLYGVLIIVMHGVRERSKVGAAGCRGRRITYADCPREAKLSSDRIKSFDPLLRAQPRQRQESLGIR